MKTGKTNVEAVKRGDMTPMIDMVFQLLIFFILIFKVVLPEGDFSIRMPSGCIGDVGIPRPILVRLEADTAGKLESVCMGSHRFPGTDRGMEQLAAYARAELAGSPLEIAATEVEFVCDYQLKYDYLIKTISACTGYVEDGQVVKLAERIKFRHMGKQG